MTRGLCRPPVLFPNPGRAPDATARLRGGRARERSRSGARHHDPTFAWKFPELDHSRRRSPSIISRSSTLTKRSAGRWILRPSRLVANEKLARSRLPLWVRPTGISTETHCPLSSTVPAKDDPLRGVEGGLTP